MNDELMTEIEEIARKKLLGDGVERLGVWNGYEVWGIKRSQVVFLGYPFVILVKDGKVRISTPAESLDCEAWRFGRKTAK